MVFISHRSWNSSRRLLACSEDRPSLRLKLEPPAPDSGGGVPDIGCSGKHDEDDVVRMMMMMMEKERIAMIT